MTAGQESLSLLAGGQIHRPANASHGCNLPANHRCEKWQRLRRVRQLGGCGREAAVHGPLLMAGGQSHRQDGEAIRAKECSAAKRHCEKWRRQRQLGGCDRKAAVHGALLMAGLEPPAG